MQWESAYVFFLFAHDTSWKQSKNKQENFQKSVSTKMSHKQKFCLKHFQRWRKSGEAVLQVVNYWKLVAMLHWLPLKEDINHLSPNIQIQILPTDFHTLFIKELLVERIWQKIMWFSLRWLFYLSSWLCTTLPFFSNCNPINHLVVGAALENTPLKRRQAWHKNIVSYNNKKSTNDILGLIII